MEYYFRLVKDGKVVGHEKHANGRIYHQSTEIDPEQKEFAWHDITQTDFKSNPFYIIEYDRKDIYIGVNYDNGEKMFLNDIVKNCNFKNLVIEYNESAFELNSGKYGKIRLWKGAYWVRTGIKGVNKKKKEPTLD